MNIWVIFSLELLWITLLWFNVSVLAPVSFLGGCSGSSLRHLSSFSCSAWLCCSKACGILVSHPGLTLHSLHWKVDSQPLDHQGGPLSPSVSLHHRQNTAQPLTRRLCFIPACGEWRNNRAHFPPLPPGLHHPGLRYICFTIGNTCFWNSSHHEHFLPTEGTGQGRGFTPDVRPGTKRELKNTRSSY